VDTDKRNELLDQMLAWFKATDAPMPTQPNPNYNPTFKPPVSKGKKLKC
jgi:hypothetical protein